jgi:hypothetical protein
LDIYKDIDWDEDDNWDNKASNAKLVAVAAEERTQQQWNAQGHVPSNVAIGQTQVRLKQWRQQNMVKDTNAMLMVVPADANNDASTVRA